MWDYGFPQILAKKIYWCGKKKVPVLVVVRLECEHERG